ncbi:FAD-dependent oxidoreductase [Pseudodesulfovibrio sp. F-1]|uniref:FAD-dependent oxidoreductase n=1 Tax=Pseudodesulfovibrio alkaliphilus TaxID=2661613 RepID=A0A7K1KNV5_9BACT|nr:FAD-dependent oxidoreductase [Pseudodesulfovibrio alkaliphilus]MUM77763.1 FAD-dependent oxidoreductase [Pseudodesulfovibrio alkaliphilus]
MASVIYGVWDGKVYDNRGMDIFEVAPLPELAGFDHFNEGNVIKAFLGDRGFFVFEPGVDLLEALLNYAAKAAEESCGKCTPCRMGTSLVRERLAALHRDGFDADLLDETEQLARHVGQTSLCGLGQSCMTPLLSALDHFREMIVPGGGSQGKSPQYAMHYVTAPCIEACPAKVNVPRYIDYIKDGKPSHSLGVILQKYPMAATCGRVCVRYCEQACRRNLVDEAVGIKVLKRYVADLERDISRQWFSPEMVRSHQPAHLRVAVVGAGPAGLSCAYHLLLRGYPVEVFEARDEPGGMAARGIPSYRLPKEVLRSEAEIIGRLGGRIHYNARLGRDFTVDDLMTQGFKAVFLGLGCDKGRLLEVQGEDPNLVGLQTGIDFLLKAHECLQGNGCMTVGGVVVVVGGGNVAMDCARSALRMGADEVHVVYRRAKADMPADAEEIEAAREEGVVFHFLTSPSRIVSKDGRVTGVELVSMVQGETDANGRRSVAACPDSTQTLACDELIAAIGQQVDENSIAPSDGVRFGKRGFLNANDTTLATSRPGVFAGGDCYLGPSTLIKAMANGLKASRSIDDFLHYGRVRFFPRSRMRRIIADFRALSDDTFEAPVENKYRVQVKELDPEVRKRLFDEVEKPISTEEAYEEANRCLRCYRIYSVITESPVPDSAL